MIKTISVAGALTILPIASHADETYSIIKYGRTSISFNHEYVVDARLDATTTQVGLGYRVNDNIALEVAYNDLGTYRFTLAKPVHVWRSLYIDIPGYAEVRVYGPSLGVKFTAGKSAYVGASVLYANAEAELHTPVGYTLYERSGMVPTAEAGLRFGKILVEYSVAPNARTYRVGVELGL